MTPNQITAIRVLAAFAAVALFGRGTCGNLAAVGLTLAAIVLDAVDGWAARLFPVPVEVCATELDSSRGRWTGEVRGEAICGAGKACAIRRLAAERGLDLARSFAYGDSYADRWMLASVGNPAAVQTPERGSRRLARLAQKRAGRFYAGARSEKWEKSNAETQRTRRARRRASCEWREARPGRKV